MNAKRQRSDWRSEPEATSQGPWMQDLKSGLHAENNGEALGASEQNSKTAWPEG